MRDFNRFHRFSANIGEMMERMGIDYDEGVEAQFGPMKAVIRSCQICRTSGICSDWLANSTVAVARAPEFCPFAERLDELLEYIALSIPSHTVH